MASNRSVKKCPLCIFEALDVRLILSHLRLVHSSDPNFSVVCGIGGCCTTSKTFSALYQHIYKKHKSSGIIQSRKNSSSLSQLEAAPLLNLPSTSEDFSDDFSCSILSDGCDDHEANQDWEHLLGIDKIRQKKASALFLLKLKETRQLSQTAIDDVVEGSRAVFSHTVQRLHSGVRAKLASLGVDETQIDSVFADLDDPFLDLETQHKQEKCFINDLGLIEPQSVFVGEPYYPVQFSGTKRSLVEKRDSFQYVPIFNTLEKLLKDQTILEHIDHPHQRSDDLLEDFCDGELVRNHPLFSSDPSALQIIAYFDELELCNPLGTHTKKHKLGIVLFTLGNIPPKYRSTLRSINLVACAVHPLIVKYGIDCILEPFIKDLNTLTVEGINVTIDGHQRNFKGGLLCFLADNPASNLLGGFKESFSFSYRFCRSCLITNASYREKFQLNITSNRTESQHEEHCTEIEEAHGELKDHYSKTYGVNRRSKLMSIINFSMFGGGLPHDVMHDVLEGVAQYEIKLLIRHCINLNYITIDEYNHRILYFDYGKNETDKPGVITSSLLRSDDKKFHLSAAQTLLLCRIITLIMGDCVPEGDEHWKCLLLLLKICDIVFSPIIPKGYCSVLKILIEEHHSLFSHLYSTASITPKFHFLVHYPYQIVALGPMVQYWTMRHEAKLCLFKKAAHLGNFKNIAYTLAHRHQRWMCYQSSSGQMLLPNYECGPGSNPCKLTEQPELLVRLIQQAVPTISEDATIFIPNWVKKNSIHYSSNNCYVIINTDEIDPIFGHIIDIYVVSGNMMLLHLYWCQTVYYDDHFHSYVVTDTPNMSVICDENLISPYVLHGHKLFDDFNKTYITLKHAFFGM